MAMTPSNPTPSVPASQEDVQEILTLLRAISSNMQNVYDLLKDVACNRRYFNVKDNGL